MTEARKNGIKHLIKERSNGWKAEGRYDYTRDYIEKTDGAKTTVAGFIGYVREGKSVIFYWRPRKKTETVYLNANGTSKGKVPKSKWDQLLI